MLRLAAALDVPLREANELLQAAGLAPAYPEADVEAPALEPFRRAIDRLLAAHEPFPALVLDAHARVVAANRASSTLFGGGLVGSNLVERYLADPAVRAAVVNWPEIAWTALDRLRKQLGRAPFDVELRRLVALAEATVAKLPRPQGAEHGLVACPWFRVGDTVIRTIAIAARFDTATEVTLDELRSNSSTRKTPPPSGSSGGGPGRAEFPKRSILTRADRTPAQPGQPPPRRWRAGQEPERAGMPASLDVAGFGADPDAYQRWATPPQAW